MFLLGVLNNSIFVILNAGAKDIVPGGVGLVYLCNTLPTLLIQGFGPYFFHLISCKRRMQIGTVMFMCSVSSVALFEGLMMLQLIGIAMGSFAMGMGETSLLGLLASFGEDEIGMWSSGTGAAGKEMLINHY